MTLAEVTARIDQIRQQLELYVGAPPSATTAFAATLEGLTGRSTAATGTTSATAAGAVDQSTAQQAVLDEARTYLGVPYLWGGTDPEKGLDCSGFVQLVYGNLGYELPRVSRDQAKVGQAVEGGLENAQPGDLLAFGSPVDHISIYVGDGQMIEAPHRGANVRTAEVWDTPVAIRRILPDQNDTTAQLVAAQQAFRATYGASTLGSL